MTPINTTLCNGVMRGDKGNILDLPAQIDPKENTVATFWEPTLEERIALVNGANLRLIVYGWPMQPVWLDVSYFGKDGPIEFNKKTLDLKNMAARLDEALEIAETTSVAADESVAKLRRIREVTLCPEDMDIVDHVRVMRERLEDAEDELHDDEAFDSGYDWDSEEEEE